jgi:hypothetical protein
VLSLNAARTQPPAVVCALNRAKYVDG